VISKLIRLHNPQRSTVVKILYDREMIIIFNMASWELETKIFNDITDKLGMTIRIGTTKTMKRDNSF